jgi:adenylosuccinate synthase
MLDGAEENSKGKSFIGTTGNGIGLRALDVEVTEDITILAANLGSGFYII